MKKLLAVLLVLCLVLPCFTACGQNNPEEDDDTKKGSNNNSSTGDLTVTVQEDVGITKDFIQALDEALILLLDSGNSFVEGKLRAVEGSAPALIDDVLYLPAEFVADNLGAETWWNEDEANLTVNQDDQTLEVSADAYELVIDGDPISLTTPAILEDTGLAVPAEPFCQALGKSIRNEDGLIIISNDLEDAEQEASSESVSKVYSALRAQLSPVAGTVGAIQSGANHDQRAECSEIIVIDPSMAPWSSPAGELAAYSGCLYIEDLSITMADENSFDCSMTVYNYLGYTYGSVEVYNSDDELVELEQIKPFQGQKDSITGAFCDIGILMSDIQKAVKNSNLDHLNYKSSLNSSIQNITVRVPVGGYVFITCNPNHSQNVALYNAAHALVEVAMATGDASSLAFGAGDADTFKQAMKDEVIDELIGQGPKAVEIAEEFSILLSKASKNSTANITGYVSEMSRSLADLFQRADIDLGELLSSAAQNAATSVADFGLETLLTSFAPFTQTALDSWSIICDASNLFCMFQDLQSVCNARSLLLETADWRAAYAKILREHDDGFNLRFMLGYVDSDMVPELIVIDAVAHFGNTLEIFSYQDGRVVSYTDAAGNAEMDIQYASFNYVELGGLVTRGGMNRGYSYIEYAELQDGKFTTVHVFNNDEGATDAPTYSYNGRTVNQWYYQWKLSSLQKEYDYATIYVDGFTDGYQLTEENIKLVLDC